MKVNLKTRPQFTVVIFALLIFGFANMTHLFGQDCTSTTDAQLVTEILDKIKASSALAPQLSHINVAAVNAAVRLHGWTDKKSDYDKLIDIISGTKCVKLINVNHFEETPPPPQSPLRKSAEVCPSGTKPCGELCIPEGDSCNIQTKGGRSD